MWRGQAWQVDLFAGENKGLVVAEIELQSEEEAIEKPPWLGKEVSGDPRYYNGNLVHNPYVEWSER
jgi:adenylate cyclase